MIIVKLDMCMKTHTILPLHYCTTILLLMLFSFSVSDAALLEDPTKSKEKAG